jgi:Sulfotransferase family
MPEVSRLHHTLGAFVERAPGILRALGRFETTCMGDELSDIRIDRPIYVCGLARAGTTILLESLATHPEVASHQYRDFPFVHMPMWWNWFLDRAGGKPADAVERAHRDGILVTPRSPEAMEEVIWMSFFPNIHDPSVCNVLGKEDTAPEFERFYRDHLRKVISVRHGSRYLAKGNYNVARLGLLHRMFPDARFVVAVRDPAQHVASLLKQHRLFCEAESRDHKVLDYMRRSGHFEFGLDRRPINFGNDGVIRRIQAAWAAGDDAKGYALVWASTYDFVLNILESDQALRRSVAIVHYDDLCADPGGTLRRLVDHCGLDGMAAYVDEQASRIAAPSYYRPELSERDRKVIREETEGVAIRFKRFGRRDR